MGNYMKIQNLLYYTLIIFLSGCTQYHPIGGHGWGFHDSFPYKRQWTEELEQWLKEEIQ